MVHPRIIDASDREEKTKAINPLAQRSLRGAREGSLVFKTSAGQLKATAHNSWPRRDVVSRGVARVVVGGESGEELRFIGPGVDHEPICGAGGTSRTAWSTIPGRCKVRDSQPLPPFRVFFSVHCTVYASLQIDSVAPYLRRPRTFSGTRSH